MYSSFLDTQYSCTTPILDNGEQELPKLLEIHSLLTQLTAHEDVMASDFICDLGFDIKILHCYDHTKSALIYQEFSYKSLLQKSNVIITLNSRI